MNNEIKQHKLSDTIKWVLTLIAFILVGVMLAGIICGWFTKSEQTQIFPGQTITVGTDGKDNTELNGGLFIPPSVTNGTMRLTAMPLSASADDGIATLAESSYTLTATVEPSNADDTYVDWAIDWTNASNSWVSGKNVTDYVTITPLYAGSLSARLSCKKAFAAQITVTVSSRHNPEIKAATTADYRERITGLHYVLSADGKDYSIDTGVAIPYSTKVTSRYDITKSIGTIASDFTVTVTMGLAPELAELIEYYYGSSWGTGFNTTVTVTENFDIVDAFDECLTPDYFGQYIDRYYAEELYYEIMGNIKEYEMNVVEFVITLTNKATGVKTDYVYDVPFDAETMMVYIDNLTLNGTIIF